MSKCLEDLPPFCELKNLYLLYVDRAESVDKDEESPVCLFEVEPTPEDPAGQDWLAPCALPLPKDERIGDC